GAEGHGEDVPGVFVEAFPLLACLRIPNLDGVPFSARRQVPAVGAERYPVAKALDTYRNGLRVLSLPQACGVPRPHPDRPVVARRGQAPGVGAERHAPDLPGVPADDAHHLAGLGVPDLHGVARVLPDEVASRGIEGHEEARAPIANVID